MRDWVYVNKIIGPEEMPIGFQGGIICDRFKRGVRVWRKRMRFLRCAAAKESSEEQENQK
jgi:hypothetical protein